MRTLLPSALSIIIVVTLITCKKSNTSTNSTSTYKPNCSGTKSYSVDVKPIIQANCVGCHSQYGNYSSVSADKSSIRNSIANGTMPKNSSLASSQKDAIMCWIDAGASNN